MTDKATGLRSRFEADGYIIVESEAFTLSTRKLSTQLVDFVRACDFACIDRDLDQRYLGDFISAIAQREQDNAITSRLYQLLPTVPAVYAFAIQQPLLQVLAEIGVTQPTLGTAPLVRIDRPREKKYQTPWHQDIWYSFSSESSVVVWMPLGETAAEQGHLVVLPGSHRKGLVSFKIYEEGHEPYTPREAPDESKSQVIPVKFGQLLIFKQTLLHKSGDNVSDRCRVSMQLRYNEMRNQEQPFATFVAKHSDHVVQQQQKSLANDA